MEEPSLRTSRRLLGGGLAAALAVGGAGFLLGRATTERPAPPPPPPPVEAPMTKPEAPVLEPAVLGRAELIALAAAAAERVAGGQTAPDAAMEGRRFEMRLPFGCGGPADEASGATLRWLYDEDAGVLRLHVAPTRWSGEEWGGAPAFQAMEGFWIPRPWTTSEACPRGAGPPAPTGAAPVTLPGQTLAIGHILPGEDEDRDTAAARDARKPYEAVVRLARDAFDPAQGFRLRLRGRVAAMPGAGSVQCRQPGGPEQRPICFIAVTFEELAVENPAGELLATWTVAEEKDDPR